MAVALPNFIVLTLSCEAWKALFLLGVWGLCAVPPFPSLASPDLKNAPGLVDEEDHIDEEGRQI